MEKMGPGEEIVFCVNTREEHESTQYNISRDEKVDGKRTSKKINKINDENKKVSSLAHRRPHSPRKQHIFSDFFPSTNQNSLFQQNVCSIQARNEIYL